MILSTFSFVVFLQHFLLHKIQHSIVEYRVRFELTTLLVCNQFPWTTRASVHGPVFLLFSLRWTGVPQISCNTTWWKKEELNPDQHKPVACFPDRCRNHPTASSKLVESQGVEPCDRIFTVYGLAIRCITILPTLQLHCRSVSITETNLTTFFFDSFHNIFK